MADYTGKKLKFIQNGNTYILDPAGILEYQDEEHFPASGVSGKIYIALDTNIIYRWDSTESEYVQISSAGGGGGYAKVEFSFATTDWTAVTGGYEASVTDEAIVTDCEYIISYTDSIETNLVGNIKARKDAANNAMVFTVTSLPTGTISGKVLLFGRMSTGTYQTVFEDIQFSIATTDWTGSEAPYTVTITNTRVTTGSGLWLFYTKSYEDYAQAYVDVWPVSGGITFATNVKPTGTLTGFVRVVDSVNGVIPPERGGTGVTSLAEVCASIGAIPTSQKGVANGVATLDGSGLIPSNQLPSYVDDVEEYSSLSAFPATGEIGKIYVATDTNKSYRWSGSTYVELSAYALATQAAAGLMSAADKTKLDGIATGATANVVSDSLSDTSTTNALSAAKGKALNDSVTALNTQITTIDGKLDYMFNPSVDGGITDATMDNLTTPGKCIIAYFNHATLGQGWGIIFVFINRTDDKWGVQVVIKDSGVYTRRRINSATWSSWTKVS